MEIFSEGNVCMKDFQRNYLGHNFANFHDISKHGPGSKNSGFGISMSQKFDPFSRRFLEKHAKGRGSIKTSASISNDRRLDRQNVEANSKILFTKNTGMFLVTNYQGAVHDNF